MSEEIWLAAAAVVAQERGPEWLDVVDDKDWSAQDGFHRGFCSSFRIRTERQVWFHFPFQLPSGRLIEQASLLWETTEGAAVTWACLHHGGMERLHLCEPGQPLAGTPAPFTPPAQWSHFYPPTARQRIDLAVEPLATRFGVQLCVLVDGPGVVRFYGAGLRLS